MGVTLFQRTSVQEVDKQMSFRELAQYGFKSESEWTPNIENSVTIKVMGREKIVLSFKNQESREQFISMIQ